MLVAALLAIVGCDKPGAPEAETPPVVVVEPQTLYVDAAATPGGDGSVERPLATLDEALALARDGDTIRLAAGRYPSCPLIESAITLLGSSPELVLIDCAESRVGVTVRGTVLRLEGLQVRGGLRGVHVEAGSYLIVQSVWVVSPSGVGIDVDGELQAQNLEIVGVTAVDDQLRGVGLRVNGGGRLVWNNGRVEASASDGLRSVQSSVSVTGVSFENNGGNGLSLQDGLDATLDRLTVSGNKETGIFVAGRALLLTSSLIENSPYGLLTSPTSKLTIENNRFERNGEGIAVVGSSGVIRENLFKDNREGGLSLQSIGEAGFLVELNSLLDNGGHGIHLSYCKAASVISNDVQGTKQIDDPAFGLVLGDGISLLESNATLTANRVVQCEGAGIYGQYSLGTLKQNTLLDNLEGGVFLTDNFDDLWILESNTLDRNVGGGIVVRNSRLKATGNTIRDSKHSAQYQVGDGIALLEKVGASEIRDNRIERSAGNGIGVYLSTVATIGGNELTDNGRFGLYFSCRDDVVLALEPNTSSGNTQGDSSTCP